jgi:hypothetical protein
MESKMNVIDLEVHRDQNREETNNDAPSRDVLESLWHGIENSRWSRDPNNPDAPPTLARFMTHVCDEAPLSVLKLLARYVEPPIKE